MDKLDDIKKAASIVRNDIEAEIAASGNDPFKRALLVQSLATLYEGLNIGFVWIDWNAVK